MKGWRKKRDRVIEKPTQALNMVQQALSHIAKGPSFIGQRDARTILKIAEKLLENEIFGAKGKRVSEVFDAPKESTDEGTRESVQELPTSLEA